MISVGCKRSGIKNQYADDFLVGDVGLDEASIVDGEDRGNVGEDTTSVQ